jgi:transcriptional regulator with XRE-family HTH domain
MTDFGNELRGLLAERGLSLREAARRAGCSPGYLSNAAHGRKPLTPSVASRLDQVLGTGDKFATYALNPGQKQLSAARVEFAHQMVDGPLGGGRPRRADNRLVGDSASIHPDSPLPTAWAATITEAKRDAMQLWRYDLEERGTVADGTTVVGNVVLSWLTAPLDGTVSQSTGDIEISPHDLKRVRAVRARLKDLDNAHGGGVAFPMAAAFLSGEVAVLLNGSCDEVTGISLMSAISEAELDAGWFAYDAGDHQLARGYLLHALRMAHAGGSRLLGARIVCALSHQALHVGQVRLSVDLARAARAGAAAEEVTPRATAMLAAMEAMAYAGARDVARCEQALNDAERALARATVEDSDPGWLDFDEGGLLGHTARAVRDLAAVGLSAPAHAMHCAQRSVELCRAGHGRTRAQRNAILATTCVQTGDIDQAAAIGELVIADAWDLRSRHVQGDIATLLASIQSARSHAARGFADRAREFLTARARSAG